MLSRRVALGMIVLGGAAAGASLAAATSSCSLVVSTDDLTGGDGAAAAGVDAGDAAPPDYGGDAGDDAPSPSARYAFRRAVTIVNGGSTELPIGFTIGVAFDGFAAAVQSGSARTDAADVRVFHAAEAADRARVVDLAASGPPAATIWFALAAAIAPGATDSSYAVEYGDPAATTPPADGAQVFPIYDDFDGPALSTAWTVNAAPTQADGGLTLHRASVDGILRFSTSDGVPATSVLEARARVSDPASAAGASGFYYWLGFQRTGDFLEDKPWSVFVARDPGKIHAELADAYAADGGPCEQSVCSGTDLAQTDLMRTYRIERGPAESRYYIDDVLVATLSQPPKDYAVMIRNFAQTSDLVVDWLRVRALSTPPPTVSLGAEEKLR